MFTLVGVHKFSKRFLLTVGAVTVALILWGINAYVGSEKVRAGMESALQRELGLPVKIGGLRFTPWGGLKAMDATCEFGPMGRQGGAPSSLSVSSISAHLSWIPLFSGRVVIEKLLFKEPVLVWVQGNDGAWNFSLECPQTPPEEAKPAPPKTKAPNASSPAPRKPKKKERSKLEFGIESIRFDHAVLRFVDRQGRSTVLFEGVNVYCRDPEKPEGTVAIGRATLREGLVVEAFTAPFSLNRGRLAVAPVEARLAGGSVRGSATLLTQKDPPFFTLDLLYNGVNLKQLLAQFGEDQNARRTAGTLHGNLDLYGRLGDKRSIQGAGQAQLRNGRMDQFPLLQLIGKVLQIEELKDLELRQAQLDLRAAEGKVFVDSLVMESLNLGLIAKGTSEWDGKLDLAARLSVNPKISRQLPGWVDAGFQPVPDSDHRDIGFNITGTVSRPSTDLLQVMMGRKYGNQFLNLWQSLTGKGKKNPEKKKPETAAPEEEGDATPLPP